MKLPEKVETSNEEQVSAGKLNRFRLDALGREICDSRPMEPPVGYQRRETVAEQIRRMIHVASQEAAQQGAETEEEANDFYMDDDPASALPPSQYEFDEDYELEQMLRRQSEAAEAEKVQELPDPAPVATKKAPTKAARTAPEPLGGEGGE